MALFCVLLYSVTGRELARIFATSLVCLASCNNPTACVPSNVYHQVYANASDSLSLLVAWDAPTDYHGANVSSYIVEFAPSSAGWTQPYVNFSVTVEEASETAAGNAVGRSAYATVVTFDADDVVCGEPWAARVRAVNEMGEGPPEWYPAVVSDTFSAVST